MRTSVPHLNARGTYKGFSWRTNIWRTNGGTVWGTALENIHV